MKTKKLMLIDGHSIMNRAFYAIPTLTNGNGIHTNAIHGFLNILFKHMQFEKPSQIVVTFDLPKPTFRHINYSEYKANRKKSSTEFSSQIPIIKIILKSMGLDVHEKEGFEADDILATIATITANKSPETDIVVITGDKDLLQIVTDKIKVKLITTSKSKTNEKDYYTKDFIEEYGFEPAKLIDYKAIMGDSSDNIKGVPRVGEKTASKLLLEYKSLENIIDNASSINPPSIGKNVELYKEQAINNKFLVTIIKDVPDLDKEFVIKENINDIFNQDFFELCKKYDLKTYLSKFNNLNNQSTIDIISNDNKTNINFILIQDLIQAQDYFKSIIASDSSIAYKLIFDNNIFLGVSFAIDSNLEEAVFIKISESITEDLLISLIKSFFESILSKSTLNKLVTIDAKTDLVYLANQNSNININAIFDNITIDIMLASYVLNPSSNKYEFHNIAYNYLNKMYTSKEELLGKKKSKIKKFLLEIEEDKWLEYACLQAYTCLEVFEIQQKLITEKNQDELLYNIEMPLLKVLASMEIDGIKVCTKELLDYKNNLDIVLDGLIKDIYELAGEEFNINSPKQLAVILFDKLELKSPKNKRSTSADILEKLKDDHEIINKILSYRSYIKLKTTYAEGLLAVIDPKTSRIYSTFKQTATATGRLSSIEPNLQNIPIRLELGQKIRKVFKPEDNFIFIDADYSQIELRVLAHLSQDEILIDAFNNNNDIHKITASNIFNKDIADITSIERSTAKAINFGLIYGKQAFSLSQELEISRKQADEYIKDYFKKYPKIKDFLNNIVQEAKDKGYTTTIYNRTRYIPEINSSNFLQKGIGERIAMNTPIQGTAADIIKIAMIKVYNKITELNLKSRLILQVHDELLIEAHLDEIDIINQILKEQMENAIEFSVKLAIDINKGETWYDAK